MEPSSSIPAEPSEESLLTTTGFLDASHNGIVVINREGRIVIYNQAARRIFGDGDAEVSGRHFSEIRPDAWPDLADILATGRPQLGRKIVLPEATIIANRSPIFRDGKVAGVISVFQDISEYETIISELQSYQKLHRELEAIFESSYDGLYITDGRAKTIRVNKAYERITGLSREEVVGRNMNDLVEEEVFDHSVTLEVLKRKRPITIMQQIKRRKQVIVTGTPIFDGDGSVSLVVTNVRDITELNALRTELEESRRIRDRYYQSLQEYHEGEHALKEMVVKSRAMAQVVHKAIKVAKAEASVLLCGESGVGKSMLARIIHQMGPRKEKPFVKINCGTIPASLMESELFGYEKGAFTGASVGGKAGLIEAGHTGTIFFDEIAELKPHMQVKLLELIEEKSYVRVGGTKQHHVDVNIIAATNRDLPRLIRKGLFRQDLYYRLNVVPIHIPPLRERREDIPALAMNILENYNRDMGLAKKLDREAMDRLREYGYPGNVRELINLIERMVILSEGETLGPDDLPGELRNACMPMTAWIPEQAPLKEAVAVVEAHMIRQALGRTENMNAAAQWLGIHPTTLWRKIVRYDIKV